MKSPQGLTFLVAAIFAIVAYFIAHYIELSNIAIAAIVFAAAFVAPLIGSEVKETTESVEEESITTLYVGNLPYRANEAAVRELFAAHGRVQSVRLMKDKHTGKRRGFGFVEMSTSDAEKTINVLNDSEFQQRTLKVREAKERPERSPE